MPANTNCFTLEREVINLRTGARDWQMVSPVPLGSCPSCCDPKDKLLSRTVVERADCAMPFADENGRTWRKRTTLKYADGSCGTYTKYVYETACSEPMRTVFLNRANMFGQCRSTVKFETTTGGVYEFAVTNTSQQIALPTGTLRVTLSAIDCGGDLQLRSLLGAGNVGSVIHISRQTPATVVITNQTYGFYVDLL